MTSRIKLTQPFVLGLVLFIAAPAGAEKIRTAIPQANLNYLSIHVADAKGFYQAEGLDNETVVISGPLSIAAMLSGDVDYSGAGGSGMRAALKGAPIKGIMFQADKVTFYLVVDPRIKTAADLKGKRIAIGSPGDTQDRIMTMFAERAGVGARDLTRIAMGTDTHTRVMAVKTGAAHATTRALPAYAGLFDGVAIRAPIPVGSIADITFVTSRKTTVDEVNRILTEEADTQRYAGVLGVARYPLVSSDIVGDPRASIVDLDLTKVIDGDLVKVMSWYDNEWGYANQMVREAVSVTRVGNPKPL